MTEYVFSSSEATKQVLDLLTPVCPSLPQYPPKNATFPLVIVNEPLQRPKQLQHRIDLQFSVEVWHNSMFEASRLFDQVTAELYKLNLRLASNAANFQDPLIKKWRKGGTFEVRFNTTNNMYEINR